MYGRCSRFLPLIALLAVASLGAVWAQDSSSSPSGSPTADLRTKLAVGQEVSYIMATEASDSMNFGGSPTPLQKRKATVTLGFTLKMAASDETASTLDCTIRSI